MNDRMNMHALADGHLNGEAKAQAEARLAGDPELRAEYESIVALKRALQKVEPVTCARTWDKCRSRLAELDKRTAIESTVGRFAWAFCSIFLCVIIGAAMFNRSLGNGVRTGDVARVLSGLTPSSNVSHPEAESMAQWIKLPSQGIRLAGAQRTLMAGHPMTIYYLEDKGGRLALLEIQGVSKVEGIEPMIENPQYSIGKLNNMNALVWSDNGLTYFLVSDRPYEELASAAKTIRQ